MDAATAAWITASATGVLAVATLIYALATRSLATAARAGVQAQVVSSARLAWMDSVRDSVAEFLSIDAEIKSNSAAKLGPEFVDNLVQRRLMIRHRIEFRLDPEKSLHKEVLAKIDEQMSDYSSSNMNVSTIRALTVHIMEEEWRRVRREVKAPVSADALGRGVRLLPDKVPE